MAQREPGRQLLKVAVGGQDLAVAVMVVRCLPAGRAYQLLADCGERDVAGEEPRGVAGLQLLLAQPAGQVVIAVRLKRCPAPYEHAEMRVLPAQAVMHRRA